LMVSGLVMVAVVVGLVVCESCAHAIFSSGRCSRVWVATLQTVENIAMNLVQYVVAGRPAATERDGLRHRAQAFDIEHERGCAHARASATQKI
jgi:hypothetical protein